jgi:hypothetical protein
MSALGDKLRKARETQVEVDGHKYTIRRPTESERVDWMRVEGIAPLELVRRCVVAWDLLETDLLPGGAPTLAPFSADAFAEFINDNAAIWQPLADAVSTAIESRLEALEEAKKN